MQTLGLVGFGVSNKAVYEHFKDKYKIFVHNDSSIPLPHSLTGVFGNGYLECSEDLIFRSPGIRPDAIKTHGAVLCEATYALSKLNCKKILVTGSDGKTTTSTLIYNVLSKKYSTFLGGNIGTPLLYALGIPLDFLVAELSSFQLIDNAPSCDVAIITSITENHLNWHRGMDEYIDSKKNLLKNAKSMILNYDNEILREIGRSYKNVSYFSLNDISHIENSAYIKDDCFYLGGDRLFSVDSIKLRGKFNLLNILASILATCKYMDKDTQKEEICSFGGVENRLEYVKAPRGVSFFNSSIDSTPSRTVATLSAFDKERCILILGGCDKNLSYEILKEGTRGIKAIIVLGENRQKILNALIADSGKIYTVNTLNEAVALAYKLAVRGDSVLLSPASCSFDMYKSYIERGNHFKALVNALD